MPIRSCKSRSFILALVLALMPALAVSQPFVERPDTELLLLALRVNNNVLNEAFPAYALGKGIIVPLGELCRELGLAIEVDVAKATADGFFISESRRFHLDVRNASVIIEGKQSSFDRNRVEVHQDDIYVDTALLAKWLPLDFNIDLYGALLTVHPREPLPMQQRLEREAQVSKTLASLGYGRPNYPLIRNPYSLFDGPFVDQQLRILRGPSSAGGSTSGFQYSTLATGDLLGLETSVFLFGDNRDPASDVRIGMGRHDPEANLLGGLHAREFGFGEVFFPGLDLVSLPGSGPGLLVSNFPLQIQSQFDQHTFIGDLPLGWEVELYRNGALIAYQQSNPNGRYEFRNTPLLFGLNVFRLVFYGPQGQRREEVQVFNVGETLTPPGEMQYRVVANDPKSLTRRSLAEVAYGWSQHFSSDASLASVDLADGSHRYGTVGLRGYWRRLFAHTDFGFDQRGGTLLRGGLQTRIGPVSIALWRAQLRDYESEVFRPLYGRIRARTTLRLSGTVAPPKFPAFPILLDVTSDRLIEGTNVIQFSNILSTLFAGTAISHRIDGTMFHGGNAAAFGDSVVGALLASRFVRSFAVRGEADYTMRPRFQTSTVGVTTETRLIPNYLLAAQVIRVIPNRVTHYVGSVAKDQGRFSFGVDADWATNGDFVVRLALSAGLYRDPLTARWRTQARPIAGRGAVAARVFLDTNGNGVWDPGEKPVENAGFSINRSFDPNVTNKSGQVLLTNLPTYESTDVSISPSTLEDPLWVPERPGVRLVARPGKATAVDFPILVSGEITGTVYLDEQRAAPGAVVELVDRNGTVVKQTRAAYDGFYDLTNIVPGEYALRAGGTARPVKIDSSGTILDGVNVVLGVGAGSSRPGGLKPAATPTTDFRAALQAFEKLKPITDPEVRYYYAVALYETGRYAEAKTEMATAKVPDTNEGRRYVAKIEGAIIGSR